MNYIVVYGALQFLCCFGPVMMLGLVLCKLLTLGPQPRLGSGKIIASLIFASCMFVMLMCMLPFLILMG